MPSPITVTFTPVLAPTNIFVYTRSDRLGLKYSTCIPGGDDLFEMGIPCGTLGTRGLPPLGSDIKIYDAYSPTYAYWRGRLEKYQLRVVDRRLVSINAIGKGFYHTGGDPSKKFLVDQVYGPAAIGSSPLTNKTNTTDIKDAMAHALSQLMPDVTYDPSLVASSSINFVNDTQTFQGVGAQTIFNYCAQLTSYLVTPMLWEVIPVNGTPTFKFWTIDTSVTYYDDGVSTQDLTYDWEGIVNRVTVEWGNNQRRTEPTDSGSPLDYTAFGGVPVIYDKYVAVQEYKSLTEVQALAQSYLQKFNELLANGSVEFTRDLRSAAGVIPLGRIRAGRIIRTEIPDDFPYTDTDRFIVATSYEESDTTCKLTCTMGQIGELYRELRRISAYPNKQIWDTVFGSFGHPEPFEKPWLLGSELPDTPGSSDTRVQAVSPVAAISDSRSGKTFGTYGGQILPGVLPDNFSEIMLPLRTNDGTDLPVSAVNPLLVIPITKDYKLSIWRAASVQTGSITVVVKKNGTTFATLTISASTTGNGTYTETTLTTGDVLTIFITANSGIQNMTGVISGNKHWPQFPTYANPGP